MGNINNTNNVAELVRAAIELAKELEKSGSYHDKLNASDLLNDAYNALAKTLREVR